MTHHRTVFRPSSSVLLGEVFSDKLADVASSDFRVFGSPGLGLAISEADDVEATPRVLPTHPVTPPL